MALKYDTRNLHGLGGRSEELQAVMDAIETDIDAKLAPATAATTYQPLTGNTFTVATLPDAASNVGRVVYCSDGSAGSACAVISDGTNWKVVAIGATAATE